MARESKTRYAVLGILAQGPRSGYEIRKIIEGSIGYFWQESYGQLYPVLKRLAAEKAVAVREVEQQGRPDKKVYTITAGGLAQLQEWLPEPQERSPLRDELLLKLFFGRLTEPESLIPLLESEKSEALRLHETLRGIKKQLQRGCEHGAALYSLMTVNYGIRYMKMQADWAKECLQELNAQIKTGGKEK